MSEGKHTPGPWQIAEGLNTTDPLVIIANVDGEYFTDSPTPKMTWDTICVCEDEYGERLGNAHANAHLIAAAPELLEALRRVAEHFPIWGEVHQIRAAIARAEGREP